MPNAKETAAATDSRLNNLDSAVEQLESKLSKMQESMEFLVEGMKTMRADQQQRPSVPTPTAWEPHLPPDPSQSVLGTLPDPDTGQSRKSKLQMSSGTSGAQLKIPKMEFARFNGTQVRNWL
ncbi:hypothetical protein ACHQM5_020280 [Ranunculus cassubicifolius]